MLLFGKCEELLLSSLYCRSAVLYNTAQPVETVVSRVHFEFCVLDHPDIEPGKRIIPSCKHATICFKYTSKLIQMENLVKLELH